MLTLKPYWTASRDLQDHCKPFGRDHLALAIPTQALGTTAYHFTQIAEFYGDKGDTVKRRRPLEPWEMP